MCRLHRKLDTLASGQLNNAPSNNYGFVMKPLQWHLEDRPEARAAMDRGGYTVQEYKNENPTLSPEVTVPTWITEMTAGVGAGMINTEGNAEGHLVNAYPSIRRKAKACGILCCRRTRPYMGIW
jgi:hypothetical protein